MKIKSPCIKVCKVENKKCIGCYRTIDEIVSWRLLTDEQREDIMQSLKTRSEEERNKS